MKMISSPFITATTAGILISAAVVMKSVAIEGPPDDAPPVPVLDEADQPLPELKLDEAAKPKPAAKLDAAFLGVVTGEIPEMLAHHLDLEPGQGVIVRALVPNGPANAAGLAINDIITAVDGEAIGSPQELSNKISASQPDEKIRLDLIQKGKPTQQDVALGSRPQDLAAWGQQPFDDQQMDLDGLPRELAERIREALAGNIGRMDLQLGEGNGVIEEAMRNLQLRMQGVLDAEPQLPGGGPPVGGIHGEAKVQLKDPQGSLEVISKDGGKEVTVRDTEGKITWSGPWDTAQDKAAAPESVRQRMESMNLDAGFKGQGLRFNLRHPAPPELAE